MQENTLAIAPQEQKKISALAVMASKVNVEPAKLLATLKDTVFQKASESELLALVVVSNEYGLNPFLKEIYAFPAKGGGIVPVVSIDGWISMMNRQEKFNGIEFEFRDTNDGKPTACTAIIHIKGRENPVRVTEYFEECFRATEPWKQMPRRMLRHKALIQGVRIAFGFSGIQDEEEAEITVKQADARVVPAAKRPKFTAEPAPEIKQEEGGDKPIVSTAVQPASGTNDGAAGTANEAPVSQPANPGLGKETGESLPLEAKKAKVAPPFVADTPHEQIALSLRDMGMAQGPFMQGLHKYDPKSFSTNWTTVAQMPEPMAQQILTEGLDTVIQAIRDSGVKL